MIVTPKVMTCVISAPNYVGDYISMHKRSRRDRTNYIIVFSSQMTIVNFADIEGWGYF